jgi:hypothetical protein
MKPINIIYTLILFCILVQNGLAVTNLVAIIPAEEQFQKVLDGLRSELGTNYHVDMIDINKTTKTEDIASTFKNSGAKALVLMDSKAVKMALELQKFDSSFITIPKFVMMTLMVDVTTKGLSNISGITFEVPAYTLITNFRIISQKDFSRVGIFYRKSFLGSIEEASRLLGKEQFTLNSICIDCEKSDKSTPEDAIKIMSKEFDKMRKAKSVDIFLSLADNLVINNKSISEFWLSKVKKQRYPVIAPLDMLANPQIALAMFTAYPDLTQIGTQAANQIIDHFENNLPMNEIGFEKTISIKSTLNANVAKELNWKLKEEKLNRINTIIK